MCKVQAAVAVTLAVCFVGTGAGAQPAAHKDQPHPRYKAQPLNLHKEQLGTSAYTAAGRSRMRAGDCVGALDSFDAALRTSNQDPTIYRDRGLCHEKLGHPYPAIDDYRVYLTDAPDAPDVEGIRARLAALEDQTSGRSRTSANDDTDVPSANASVTVGAGSTQASASATSRDKLQYVDPTDDPLNASLRRGRGFSLAPFFSERKWFTSGSSFGDAGTWAEAVGGQLRYAVGPVGSLVLEVGYEHFNSTSIDAFIASGLTTLLAFEFRFPLDADYNNQLFLAAGLGYDHVTFSPSDPQFQASPANALIPKLRFGYRHLLEDSAGLDVSMDAGVAEWLGSSGAAGPDLSSTITVALNVGVVWGL